MNNLDAAIDLQNIIITATNADGARMTLDIPGEDDLDAWQMHLKTILTHLGFIVDEVEINSESDEYDEDVVKEEK